MNTIEPLELRIAPAAVFKFTDVDGDDVTVTASTGTLDEGVQLLFSAASGPRQLQTLVLTSDEFAGANISIVAKRSPANGGDGLVNVGYINAAGVDLGAVLVDGDLGAVDTGNTATATPGLKSLAVQSLGAFGLSTGASSLQSDIMGALGALKVKSDVRDASVIVMGNPVADGKIGSITIGGSLIGGTAFHGELFASGAIGAVKIGHDIVGGTGGNAGLIQAGTKIASVTVGGSLIGGTHPFTGSVTAGDIGAVKIGGDIRGGFGGGSGKIEGSVGKIVSVTVNGSVIGSKGENSGGIFGENGLGPVKIGGDLRGGDSTLNYSGSVFTNNGDIASVSIGRSLLGGSGPFSGIINAGAAGPTGKLGPVKIGAALVGGSGESSGRISCGKTMASLSIGQSVIGGAGKFSAYISATTGVGPVTIRGDLVGGGSERAGMIESNGDIGPVTIRGDLIGGSDVVTGAIMSDGGGIVALTIDGSIIGGSGLDSGFIFPGAKLGTVKIGGDVRGGTGKNSGSLQGGSGPGGINIAGSIIGGTNVGAGYVRTVGGAGIRIGGDIIGGGAEDTGELDLQLGSFFETVNTAVIGGSIIGGSASRSGVVFCFSIGSIVVGGDIRGGDAAGSDLTDTGTIRGRVHLGSVTVGGSIIAGRELGIGQLTHSGSVGCDLGDLGSLAVKGSLIGNAANPVTITASDAIKKIAIDGRVEHAQILAGYDENLNPIDGDAGIGAVKVRGDWIASDLVAGATTGANGFFGDSDDASIGIGNPDIFSKIASIVIGGHVQGTVGVGDHFGFVAEQIGSFKVDGTIIPLSSDPMVSDDRPIGITGDVAIHEI